MSGLAQHRQEPGARSWWVSVLRKRILAPVSFAAQLPLSVTRRDQRIAELAIGNACTTTRRESPGRASGASLIVMEK